MERFGLTLHKKLKKVYDERKNTGEDQPEAVVTKDCKLSTVNNQLTYSYHSVRQPADRIIRISL